MMWKNATNRQGIFPAVFLESWIVVSLAIPILKFVGRPTRRAKWRIKDQ